MRGARASKGHHVAQTAASRAHIADIHHLQAYPPKSRPTLAPSLTTTLIYTLGANARRALLAAMANASTVRVLVVGRDRNLKGALTNTH